MCFEGGFQIMLLRQKYSDARKTTVVIHTVRLSTLYVRRNTNR